ncbi:HEAT repeat domain-containing protein [Streptomyces sp. NPDC059247]|uniref:HEAT repeat domain-containing protein n=1 Tax=Streptomyces sp. NPDC059247 TaxID=3346790 RepID=UPI0036B99897
MIDNVENTDWASMTHAYGPAHEVPEWLNGMVSPDPRIRDRAFEGFYGAVHHQGDVYTCTVATLPFLFAIADDPGIPDRGSVLHLLLSIGRHAAEHVGLDDDIVVHDLDGEESTAHRDALALMREHAETFVSHAGDTDLQVRMAAIPGLALFLEDASQAIEVLRGRLTAARDTAERFLVVETIAELALRLPSAQVPAREWLAALADGAGADADVRLASLVHRARCVPESVDDTTVPAVIGLLRQVTPTPPAENAVKEAAGPCTCPAESGSAPGPGVPAHIAAAFDDLDRHGRRHAATTSLLTALHTVLGDRVQDRTRLLGEQLSSEDRATRYDAIAMAQRLIEEWRGDHPVLIRLLADCLLPDDAYTAAAAAEALGRVSALAEPAREALATYVTGQRTTHRSDAWASPHPLPRRAHQQAVLALARLGDVRALPSLLTALDTGTDAWRAVQIAGRFPQAAAELAPRLVSRLASLDFSEPWPDIGAPSLASALAALDDPAAVPALTEALQAAVRHQDTTAATAVLNALASFGPRARSALDVVRSLSGTKDTTLRTAAAGALWELERRPDTAVPLLEHLIHDNRDTDAVRILGRIGPPAATALPRLRQILDEQTGINRQNTAKGRAVLNMGNAWTLVRTASALWETGGLAQADTVVPALLTAWNDNSSTRNDVAACLSRMGPAARPALPRVQAALAAPRRHDTPWGGDVASDLAFQNSCHTILANLHELPDQPRAADE